MNAAFAVGRLEAHRGNHSAANAWGDWLVLIAPEKPHGSYLLGLALEGCDAALACSHFRDALTTDPEFIPASRALAANLLEQYRDGSNLAIESEVLALWARWPEEFEIQMAALYVLIFQGRTREARKVAAGIKSKVHFSDCETIHFIDSLFR